MLVTFVDNIYVYKIDINNPPTNRKFVFQVWKTIDIRFRMNIRIPRHNESNAYYAKPGKTRRPKERKRLHSKWHKPDNCPPALRSGTPSILRPSEYRWECQRLRFVVEADSWALAVN